MSYETKFADLIRMCEERKAEVMTIHHPQVLGDNYEEIVESLNRIADAGMQILIVPRKDRG